MDQNFSKENIGDLNKKSSSLSAEIAKIENEIKKAETELTEAVFQNECSPNGESKSKVELIEADLKALKLARDHKKKTLSKLSELETKARSEAAKDDTIEKWDQVEQITKKRTKLAAKLKAQVAGVSDLLKEIGQLGIAAYQIAPQKDNMGFGGCPLNPDFATAAFQRHLEKEGISSGKFFGPNERHRIPDFVSVLEEQHSWILKFKPLPSAKANEDIYK